MKDTTPEPHRCIAARDCRDVENTEDPTTGRTIRRGALIPQETGICDACRNSTEHAVNDMIETWLALHIAIGDANRRQNQKVTSSRTAPINLNTDADSLKTSIVEWLTAAAARVAEALNINDPKPHNNTDAEHARVIIACTRILAPNIDKLVTLPADDLMVWKAGAETQYPGERAYIDELGVLHTGIKIIPMTGAELALQLIQLRRKARSFLALTAANDKLSLPCPGCNEYELSRTHDRRGSREIDQIDCAACKLSWPYERYRQLCLIWVKEDEMEREKLQKKLDAETAKRKLAEWLLAKREWQISLGLNYPGVTAHDFARTILDAPTDVPTDAYMTDRDIANLIGVSDSTIRSWASRGQITRHTADDGSTKFLASEVWEYAINNPNARTATNRRLTNRKARNTSANTNPSAMQDKPDVACHN